MLVTGLWNHVESGRLAGFSVLPDPAFSRVSGRYSRACWSPERVLSGVFLDGARFFSLSRALPFLGALLKQEWVGWALIDQRLVAANNRYGAKHATKLVLSERTYGYEEAE